MKADEGINTDSLQELTQWAVRFQEERDWKQHHSPKNLATSLVVEAAELLEHYRFKDAPGDAKAVADEAADVLLNLLLFCEAAGIDLSKVAMDKWKRNAEKYPVAEFHGSADKYNER